MTSSELLKTRVVAGPLDPAVPPAALPRPAALPTSPTEYHHFLRTPRSRWWKGVLAIVSLVVGYVIVSLVLGQVAMIIDTATGRTTWEMYASGEITVTPMMFVALNLSLAAQIPLALLLQWAFYGQRPRWLSSVQGGFRWRWFGRAALIVVPIWVVYAAAAYLLEPERIGRLSADASVLLIAVLLTTPLQAAGEEYGGRGLINRAAASWSANPKVGLVLGIVVSSALFMLAHGAGDPWLLVYYFVVGAAMAVMAWRTGGLEVPVLVHMVNNVLLLVPGVLFGDLAQLFNRGPGAGGPIMLVPMVLFVAVIAVIEWWRRRSGVARRSIPAEVSHV